MTQTNEYQRTLINVLPEEGYQDNDIVRWLCTPWDNFLTGVKETLDTLPTQLDPTTCDPEWLDYLAALSGFTGRYWSAGWTETTKRTLINLSHRFLWRFRGTREVLETVLNVFLGNRFDIWQEGEFRCDVTTLPGELGSPELKYFIRLPLEFRRDGEEFRTATLMNELYGIAACESEVMYDGFYCDFSICGDAVFDEEDTIQ